MIPLSEFRIGMMVHATYAGNINDHLGLAERSVTKEDFQFDELEHWYFPVPLSPDLFSRMGFYGGSKTWRTKEPFRHHVVERDGKYYYRVPGVTLREVKYAHEVQNLYFLITGQEIVVKAR